MGEARQPGALSGLVVLVRGLALSLGLGALGRIIEQLSERIRLLERSIKVSKLGVRRSGAALIRLLDRLAGDAGDGPLVDVVGEVGVLGVVFLLDIVDAAFDGALLVAQGQGDDLGGLGLAVVFVLVLDVPQEVAVIRVGELDALLDDVDDGHAEGVGDVGGNAVDEELVVFDQLGRLGVDHGGGCRVRD